MSNKNLKEKDFHMEMKGLRKYLGEKFEGVNKELGDIKTDVAVLTTDKEHLIKHVDALETKSNRNDILNTIAAVIAGVVGVIVRPGE